MNVVHIQVGKHSCTKEKLNKRRKLVRDLQMVFVHAPPQAENYFCVYKHE